MACNNGNDGYPCQAEFNRRMENYIVRKKRSERTVVSEGELAIIYNLLSDPAAMRAETDVSHRTWVKKTFMLKSFTHGTFVCHKDKGQSSVQPVASKEKMYYILKQAHASEGHGGRDKTAKAVKKTHSFIRKGLICLFLEVCPTCRARNEAVKKDKFTSSHNTSEANSPFSHLDSASNVDPWDQSASYALRSANPYQSSTTPTTLHSTSPLYPPEDYQRLTIPTLSTALKRAPSHGVVGTLFPEPASSHVRSHTFPLLDSSYPAQPDHQYGQPSLGYTASPSPLLSAGSASQMGSVYESYNPDHLSELTAALQQQSFCAPIFAVQVDAPGHQQGASAHEYFQGDQPYFHHQQPASSSSSPSSSEAHNLSLSNNLYDPVNMPYLLGSQPENPYPSSSVPAQLDSFPAHDDFTLEHARSPSNSSLQAHYDTKPQLMSNLDGASASLEFTTNYGHLSTYQPTDAGIPEPYPAIQAQAQPAGPHRRSFADKNHKNLSLQCGPGGPDGFRNNNTSADSFSGPSTAGSNWTIAEDMSLPMSDGDFHHLLSSLSSTTPDNTHEDQLLHLHC
ncbi:hypothetical protein PCASD_16509 [Puccinia coronata f. sp. avenae]|uniref:Integrase zinc-binding domain-containing protein n=1 Tax=Puccinia coronata f. sp. avenae TaxID=200324 RepID=A0A2N5TCB9_9BASI|nr:hypothetical protein PCASD_16509 [Puccinia coronata f. sp. avenae]